MWIAQTSDGNIWREDTPSLQVAECSPWRELEALCAVQELTIVKAEVHCGEHWLSLDAQGGKLTCGRGITLRLDLCDGGGQVQETVMFVRRECPDKWTWAVVGAGGWYIAEAPAGVETMPQNTESFSSAG